MTDVKQVRETVQQGFDWLQDMLRGDQAEQINTPSVVVQGGLGQVPNAEHAIDTTRKVPQRKITTKDAQTIIMGELAGAVRELYSSTTQLTSQINRGGAKNGVIGVSAALIPTAAAIEVSRPVTIGSIIVSNTTTSTLMVQIGPGKQDGGPTHGQGLFPVPAGQFVPVPIGAKTFVIYGPAGGVIGLQLFTGLQAYGASL
jgi:hypothetical protein